MGNDDGFVFERYTVYKRAMAFFVLSMGIEAAIARRSRYLADQLARAAMSIVLNITEGAGEYRAGERAKFFRYSLRSAQECAGILAMARARAMAPESSLIEARALLNEVVALLTTMINNPPPRPSDEQTA